MKSGDKVVWDSQSGGSWTEKRGTVIREIPAGESAMQYIHGSAKKSHVKFKDISDIDRILVAVTAGKDGKITYYYCPRKSVVKVLENMEE